MPNISGRVYDMYTGQGLPVTIMAGTYAANAGSNGAFSFSVPNGSYNITIIYSGYDNYSTTIYVTSDVNLGEIGLKQIFRAL